ncbi:MAG: sigma-70 family RNA polymerase sigma factor [Pirellulales bacterium]|nr:sigma-70 family RNA polymerase sigma factor [Pirellulales bacterium]
MAEKQALSIRELIEQARADPAALGDLLERYRSYLLLISRQQINPKIAMRSSPSDIVQESFAEAYRGFERFTGSAEPEFSAWLGRIHQHNLDDAARKHLLAKRRDAAQEKPLYSRDGSASFTWREIAADQQTPSDRVIAGEKALRLAEMLTSLPDAQREAVRMRHLEGLTLAEIAEGMERSLEAVAGLLKRGLKTLREKMSEESWF